MDMDMIKDVSEARKMAREHAQQDHHTCECGARATKEINGEHLCNKCTPHARGEFTRPHTYTIENGVVSAA